MKPPITSLADGPSVPEEQLHEQRAALAKGAEARHPGAGWRIYQWWREMSEDLFGRQLPACGIRFGPAEKTEEPGEPGFGAWCRPERTIILHPSLLHQDGSVWHLHHDALGSRFPRDVLLHQMVHQYIDLVRGVEDEGRGASPTGSPYNNRWWAAEVNRLSEVLVVGDRRAAVLPADVETGDVPDGILTAWEAARWPYVVRPEGYYRGDPAEVLQSD